MIHEIAVEADSFKQTLGMCSSYCGRLDSFPLIAIRFEIESVTRVENDEGNNACRQNRLGTRKRKK